MADSKTEQTHAEPSNNTGNQSEYTGEGDLVFHLELWIYNINIDASNGQGRLFQKSKSI